MIVSIQIYNDSNFKVYKFGNEYILHNIYKEFSEGHTHVQKYDTCMVMIKLIERKQLPKSRSKHFIESLIRVSSDRRYARKVLKLI
ncbi:hypothetical protein [Clostridium sp. OS1-26]|uniref:hypothetical protein n=1 Tax=Clostridium sp. OS1-26 TaxID=3070681 RepID=UPI0027E08867|nr:hypothetical protein [Clostridium sp. OS1-26]WML33032.1 hypothetical protein RCG18_16945 [Clostridium sp. OS1-26]